jgi:hypothetical protein
MDFSKNFDNGDSVWAVIHYSDGSTDRVQLTIGTNLADGSGPDSDGVITYNGSTDIMSIDAPQGLLLDYIDFAVATNGASGKLIVGDVTISENNGLVEFDVPITAYDGDGDFTTGTISVDVQGDHVGTTFTGTSGDDVFSAGAGDDFLVGGSGEDLFAFSAKGGEGDDTILDFNAAEDILSFQDVLDNDGDAVVDLDDLLDPNSAQFVDFNKVDATTIELTVHGSAAEATTITLRAADGTNFNDINQLTDLNVQVDPNSHTI